MKRHSDSIEACPCCYSVYRASAKDLYTALEDILNDLELRAVDGVVPVGAGVYAKAKAAIKTTEKASK